MNDKKKSRFAANCLECDLPSVSLCHCVKDETNPAKKQLTEGIDYYIDNMGKWVFTALYHLRRGYCCKNGCRHCPYKSI